MGQNRLLPLNILFEFSSLRTFFGDCGHLKDNKNTKKPSVAIFPVKFIKALDYTGSDLHSLIAGISKSNVIRNYIFSERTELHILDDKRTNEIPAIDSNIRHITHI